MKPNPWSVHRTRSRTGPARIQRQKSTTDIRSDREGAKHGHVRSCCVCSGCVSKSLRWAVGGGRAGAEEILYSLRDQTDLQRYLLFSHKRRCLRADRRCRMCAPKKFVQSALTTTCFASHWPTRSQEVGHRQTELGAQLSLWDVSLDRDQTKADGECGHEDLPPGGIRQSRDKHER